MPKVRTQIQLEKEQYDILKEEAFRRNQSLSEIIRMLIEKNLISSSKHKKINLKKASAFIGTISGDNPDVAEQHDKYLTNIY